MSSENASGGDEIFDNVDAFRAAFEQRLFDLVDHDVLGVFILALANASFEGHLFERLGGRLRTAFMRWEERFESGDRRAVGAAPDDIAVFQRLREHGFDRLETTRWRRCGPWWLQFNPLRSFRPPRMSHTVVDSAFEPFDDKGFHFNKAFLRDEILWQGEITGTPVRLLYNKFPFAELHGLLVPAPAQCRPQCLRRSDLDEIWQITEWLGMRLPGVGFGYNSYGAYASVNHMHFQMYCRGDGIYPVERPGWTHNGGRARYPAVVATFDGVAALWQAVEAIHRANGGYNLLLRPGRAYLVRRALQGSYVHSDWTGGFAWSECAGVCTLFDEESYAGLSEGAITAELAAMALR
jgi:hypothetical protein